MNNQPARKSVLICDSQPLVIEGIRWLLDSSANLRFAGAVCSLDLAFELLRTMNPDALLLDKNVGEPAVTDFLHHCAAEGITVPVVVWGPGINEPEALRLLQAGARGILRRTAETQTLITCLNAVTSGTTWMEDGIFGDTEKLMRPRRSALTAREAQVAELVEHGMKNRDIAKTLGIQTGTVKIHLKHIFEKTGVRGRYGLAFNSLREKGAIPTTPGMTM